MGDARPARRTDRTAGRTGLAGAVRSVRRVADRGVGRGDLGGVHPRRRCGGSAGTASPRCRRHPPAAAVRGPPPRPAPARRPARDPTCSVHDLLIRFCPRVPRPGVWPTGRCRDATTGFYRAFCRSVPAAGRSAGAVASRTGRRARPAAGRRRRPAGVDPRVARRCSASPRRSGTAFLSATLLALRGWGGIIRFIEERPDRVGPPGPGGQPDRVPGRPADAGPAGAGPRRPRGARVHRAAARAAGRAAARARRPAAGPSVEQRAFPVFQLAQVLGWTPEELPDWPPAEWAELVGEIEAFPAIERRRVFHLAYERRFYDADARRPRPARRRPAPTSGAAAVPGDLLHRRARGVVPPAPRGGRPRLRDVRHRRLLRRGDVLPRGGRRPLRPALPGRDPPAALGRRSRWRTAWTRRTGGGRRRGGRSGSASHQVHVGSRTFAAGARAVGRGSACWRRSRWSPASCSRG